MTDRLTQLQDAVDQLANQMVSSIYYVQKHHDLQPMGPKDAIINPKKEIDPAEEQFFPRPVPAAEFNAAQLELSQDLIVKEQQIELLISMLPGLVNSEKDQEEAIRKLEGELKEEEEKRKAAVKEKELVLAKLENAIRSVKRP